MNCILCFQPLELTVNEEKDGIYDDYQCTNCQDFFYSIKNEKLAFISIKLMNPDCKLTVYGTLYGTEYREKNCHLEFKKNIFPKELTLHSIEDLIVKLKKLKNFT